MNILQLNFTDLHKTGGTGIAMRRLHESLQQSQIQSRILCAKRTLPAAPDTQTIHRPVPIKALEVILRTIGHRLGLNNLHPLTSFTLPNHPFYREADLLHLHCMHQGFFNYLALPALTRPKPTIFTLHDMWAFTGGCYYSNDCDRWQTGCGPCPRPELRMLPRDASHWEWHLKHWAYQRSNLVITTPSEWMSQQARQSFLNRFPIHTIPNGVDTNLFRPLDPQLCRAHLGLPPDKKVLMFVAYDLKESRKGGDLLMQALQTLPPSLQSEIVLLVMGKGGEAIAPMLPMPVVDLGLINDDSQKAIAYSAADLFLFPTRADNGPLVILESLACGTPIVSFRVGGVPEFIRPDEGGYLAEPEDVADFRNGIMQLLEDANLRTRLSCLGRDLSVREYSLELHTQRYIRLYESLLTESDLAPELAYTH